MKNLITFLGILLLLWSCDNGLSQSDPAESATPESSSSVTIAIRKPDIQQSLDQFTPLSESRAIVAEVQFVEIIICPDSVASAITNTEAIPASATLDTIKADASTVSQILAFGGGNEIIETLHGIAPGNSTIIVGTFDGVSADWSNTSYLVSYVVSKNNLLTSGSNSIALPLRLNASRYEMRFYWGSLMGYTFDMYNDTSWSNQNGGHNPETIIFGAGNIKAGTNHIYLQQGLTDPYDEMNQYYIDPVTINFYDHEGRRLTATYDTGSATPFWILNIPSIAQQADYRLYIVMIASDGSISAGNAFRFNFTADAGYQNSMVEPYTMGNMSMTEVPSI